MFRSQQPLPACICQGEPLVQHADVINCVSAQIYTDSPCCHRPRARTSLQHPQWPGTVKQMAARQSMLAVHRWEFVGAYSAH